MDADDVATCCGCSEYQTLERRSFLRTVGHLGGALTVAAPAWLPRLAFAADEDSDRDLLVCVFLRGGADGLTLCVPHGEDEYYNARPELAVPPPDAAGDQVAIDLDGFFGLPPALAPLKPIYDSGQLAIVHATGSPDPTRSHFSAQDFMENGTPGDATTLTGWLGRHLLSVVAPDDLRLRGLAASTPIPRSLWGGPATAAIPSVEEYGLQGRPETSIDRLELLTRLYAGRTDALSATAANVAAAIALVDVLNSDVVTPSGGAVYPGADWGIGLQTIARVAKADVGLYAATIDLGGWDTHAHQGTSDGKLGALMTTLADGLAAFHTDMSDMLDRLTVLVMSEFGRRVWENGSAGTDHGHGNAMFLLGGNVNGGQVITSWPGLHPDQLDDGRDLAITIDYRDVVGEVLEKRGGNSNLDVVFPDYSPSFANVVY